MSDTHYKPIEAGYRRFGGGGKGKGKTSRSKREKLKATDNNRTIDFTPISLDMHTARTHESRYWQKFLLQDFTNTCMLLFSPCRIVQILQARNIASCCANKNALCQPLSTSYDLQQRIVCWRAMQHSELAAGPSFGSFLCRCYLLLFRCSNLP